jgi:hypothetical protein
MLDNQKPRPARTGSLRRVTRTILLSAACLTMATGCDSGARAGTKVSYPSKNLAAFKSFAATGDAGAVHSVGTSSTGQRSCPTISFGF